MLSLIYKYESEFSHFCFSATDIHAPIGIHKVKIFRDFSNDIRCYNLLHKITEEGIPIYIKSWNSDLKNLKEIIFKEEKIEESKELCLRLHAMVHSSDMSGIGLKTFEDELWENMDEETFRTSTQKKGRTVAYGMWHSTRIEDITMNILVDGGQQVLNAENMIEKINSSIKDTGNSLSPEEILLFSRDIDMYWLREYRKAVGRKTESIIRKLEFKDMKRKILPERLDRVINEGAVLKTEGSVWLIDFWGRKNVAGILFMPVLRHHLVHINESMQAKKKRIK